MASFSTVEAYHVLGQLLDASEHPKASLDDRLALVKQCWEALQACGGTDGAHQGSGVRAVGGHASTHHDSQPTPASIETPLSDIPPHQEPQQQEVAAMEEGSTMLWQALGQQQYLLALDLYMSPAMEHHAAADMLACQLGMAWRLSDPVWATCQRQGAQPCSVQAEMTQNAVQISEATASQGSLLKVPSFSPPLQGAGSINECTGTISNRPLSPHQQLAEGAGGKGPVARSQSPGQNRQLRPHMRAPHQLPLPKPSTFHSPLVLAPGTAVSYATLQALTTAFTTTSPYWSDHGYFDPDTPFFSYTYDLGHPPSSIVEVAAQEVHRWALAHASGTPGTATDTMTPESGKAGQGSESSGRQEEQGLEGTRAQEMAGDGAAALAAAISSATHVEWWAHTRSPDAAHQLHFDCDETKLRKGRDVYTLRHPAVSSVLFLTPHGGPTLVLDQAPGASRLADRAWAVQPEPGALLAFPGNLLHGVLPGAVAPEIGMASPLPTECDTDGVGVGSESAAEQGRGGCMGQRVTLVLAWWDRTRPLDVGGSSTQGFCGVSSLDSSRCNKPCASSVAAAVSAADVASAPPQGAAPAFGPSIHPTPTSSGLVEDTPSLPSFSATLRPQMLPPWSQSRKKQRVQGPEAAVGGEEATVPTSQAAVGGGEYGGDVLPTHRAPGFEAGAVSAEGPPLTVVEKPGLGGGGAGAGQQQELEQGHDLAWVQLFIELAGAGAREGVLSEGNDADADQGACSGQGFKPAMCVSPVWVPTHIQGSVHVGTDTGREPGVGVRSDAREMEKGAGSEGTVACTAAASQPSACLALLRGALPDLRLMLPDEGFINALYPVV